MRSNVDFLQKNQQPRLRQLVSSQRWYGNIGPSSVAGTSYARLLQSQTAVKDRMTFNAIASIVDTLTSRVGENKPRPFYITNGGNYRSQRKAKKLNKFSEGAFYETKSYDLGNDCFRDGAIDGDGLIHVFARGGKLIHQRVQAHELWIDEVEGQYGFPRTMYRTLVADKDELAERFHESRDDILTATRSADTQGTAIPNLSNMVTVVEAWHLAAMNEDGKLKGGSHAIALLGGKSVMLVPPEDWPYDFFPFARFSWCRRPQGYWSQGIPEQLQGDQAELNKELWFTQRAMHLAGTIKVFLRNGSKVVKEHINNEIGAIISHTGDPPVFFCPEPIHQVYFENPNRIIERMYNRVGASQLDAQSKLPAGLEKASGVAIREYEDIGSDRFRSVSRANDNLYLQLAALDIVAAREAKKAGHPIKVRVPGRTSFSELDFGKDVGDIEDNDYIMQCMPVSRLPRDPSGRLATVQEYIQAGFMTPRQGRRALDFPDLDTVESLANAQEDLITEILDDIVDEGKYAPPEPTDDFDLAKELVVEYIQRFRRLELEPERMAMLRSWNSQVDAWKTRMLPPPVPATGVPQAAAQPPPVSPLVPNAPGAPGPSQAAA